MSYPTDALAEARALSLACAGVSRRLVDRVTAHLDAAEARGEEPPWEDIVAALRALATAGERYARLAQLLAGEPTERTEAHVRSLADLLTPPGDTA